MSSNANGPQLNGLYELALPSEGVTQNGKPVNDPQVQHGSMVWAFRSACSDTGCVATGSLLKDKPPAPPAQQMVFDFVGGRWLGVAEMNSSCKDPQSGQSRDAPVWMSFSLEPHENGTLTGTAQNVGLDACRGIIERPVTATRKANIPAAVTVNDPAKESPPVTSPAQSFRGRYSMTYAGEDEPASTWMADTLCVRSGDKCVTLLNVTPNPSSGSAPYTDEIAFANGQWTQVLPLGQQPCSPGSGGPTTNTTRFIDFALPPQPVPNPIPVLSVNQRVERTGDACPGTFTTTASLNRTGD
jgi:hypothetical protein